MEGKEGVGQTEKTEKKEMEGEAEEKQGGKTEGSGLVEGRKIDRRDVTNRNSQKTKDRGEET
jgi:hypothetical protein